MIETILGLLAVVLTLALAYVYNNYKDAQKYVDVYNEFTDIFVSVKDAVADKKVKKEELQTIVKKVEEFIASVEALQG